MGLVDDIIRDGEDVLFSTASLMHAGSVRIDNSISGYNYRVLDSSMSHEYNRKYYENKLINIKKRGLIYISPFSLC